MKTAWMKIAVRVRTFLDRLGEDFEMSLIDEWTSLSVKAGDFDCTDEILFA